VSVRERRGLIAGLLGFGALLALFLLRPSTHSTAVDFRVESIQRALADEQRAREALAREVAELRRRIEGGAAPLAAPDAERTARVPDVGQAETSKAPIDEPAAVEPGTAAEAQERSPVFDEEGLVAAGLDRLDAGALRERWEQYELDKLELNDRAMREAFFMTPRHRDEHLALDLAFRTDVGEEGYGAYLYATGQSNRVVVREVIPNSAAAGAGLQRGDEIVRYDGASVFSTTDLQLQTASGARGDLVTLQVVRDGQPITLRAERGPLGVVLDGARRSPGTP